MAYFKVLSALRHDGTDFPAGSFIEAADTAFPELVSEGVLQLMKGAETLEDAKAMDQEAIDAAAAKKAEEAPAAGYGAEGNDTYGPSPEKPVVTGEETTEEAQTVVPTEPVLAKFTVLKDFEVTNEQSKNFGKHVAGDVIEADAAAAEPLVENGTLEAVTEEEVTGENL